MIKIVKKILIIVTIVMMTGCLCSSEALAQNRLPRTWEPGYCTLGDAGSDFEDVATVQGIVCLMANVLRVAVTLLGLTGFVMFIYGALKWMLSGGNSSNVEKARNTMTFVVVGIIVALSCFVVINLIEHFTGLESLTKFVIPDWNMIWTPDADL